ncbi:phage holin [Bifidobacterium panos]|uniref:Holin n=1 Tax=Bifidobacterium panos TaxID=2675321 RepID=A0ABX1SYT5_9BIFI|nr:phage holin [Bifidobacterium sp. DSM 109963]NMN01769.1 holin [Bifidobacterium sp. DSM 109963]
MSELKHAEGTTPETDEQTDARLATLATVETATATDAATDGTATAMTTDDTTDGQMPDWLLPDKAYQVLKWLTLTVLPALAVLVGALGPVWGLTMTDAVVTTISAVALFFGAVIGVSAIRAKTV